MSGDPRSRWNRTHAQRLAAGAAPSDPVAFLTDRAALLPGEGRALDVAGGAGRNALWLAARGHPTTLVDVSDTACAAATARAEAAGVTLDVVRAELDVAALPAGPFAVVVVHHFLDRAVWAALPTRLGPGGVLLACQPTVTNLERHDRPARRWLLEVGEVRGLAAAMLAGDGDLEVVEAAEDWSAQGRHEATLVVRRRA